MTYATLMVHLELGRSNEGLLDITRDLAGHFKAAVIGIAGAEPMWTTYGGDNCLSGEIFEQERETIDADIATAEAEFRQALDSHGRRLDWRSAVTFAPMSVYLANEARSADLILTNGGKQNFAEDTKPQVNAGELALQAGRPILVVPPDVSSFKPGNVIVAWKNTRESRRAVMDALPLLKMATRVPVVTVAAASELRTARAELMDVVAWLRHHDVAAECHAVEASYDEVKQIGTIADDMSADLMVAGAYGHSRVREWALGGMTHHLLLCSERCILISH